MGLDRILDLGLLDVLTRAHMRQSWLRCVFAALLEGLAQLEVHGGYKRTDVVKYGVYKECIIFLSKIIFHLLPHGYITRYPKPSDSSARPVGIQAGWGVGKIVQRNSHLPHSQVYVPAPNVQIPDI